MKIIDQQGKEQEIFEIEQTGCEIYGQPRSIKKPKVFLGKYSSTKRAIEVMAEAYFLNNKDKTLVYTMPQECETVKELITKKESKLKDYTNDLTREMDSFLKSNNKHFENYIYDKFQNKWIIRYPGATRGYIEVDENDIIVDIVLYHDSMETDKIYLPEIRECFSKYIGMKLVIEN